MKQLLTREYWTGPRLFALAASSLVVAIFVGANIHLVTVAFSSQPDCVLQPSSEGAARPMAAKPSC